MSRDDIIRMAREVFDVETDNRGRETFSGDNYGVERFAALVAAAEREACAQTARTAMLGAEWVLTERVMKSIRARSNP